MLRRWKARPQDRFAQSNGMTTNRWFLVLKRLFEPIRGDQLYQSVDCAQRLKARSGVPALLKNCFEGFGN
jgi:hypothetical protein